MERLVEYQEMCKTLETFENNDHLLSAINRCPNECITEFEYRCRPLQSHQTFATVIIQFLCQQSTG